MKKKKHFLIGAKIIDVIDTHGPMFNRTEIKTTKGNIFIESGDAGTFFNPEPSFNWGNTKKDQKKENKMKIYIVQEEQPFQIKAIENSFTDAYNKKIDLREKHPAIGPLRIYVIDTEEKTVGLCIKGA